MTRNTDQKAWVSHPLIGVSENIKKARALIDLVADSGFNIVISGETGVGKEVVAQNLHFKSSRKDKPFIKINCAALPEGLLESELFGYEKGSFTGADRRKRGKFELSHGGVLFLDEIGDMAISLQSKLLHVLQTGEFSPIGSERDLKTDTWIIAATNHNLEENVKDKTFREDLYYRLNIIRISLSPLRRRKEDIPHLIDYFLEDYTERFHCNTSLTIDGALMDKMRAHEWPGNVRELQNILKRMLVMGDPDRIMEKLLRGKTPAAKGPSVVAASHADSIGPRYIDLTGLDSPELETISLKEIKKNTLVRVEKEVIAHVLGKTDWNRSKASKILKISYRTMLNKIKEHRMRNPLAPADAE